MQIVTEEEINAIDQGMCGEREFIHNFAKQFEALLLRKLAAGVAIAPNYLYHYSEDLGEDELFDVAISGRVDEVCANCVPLFGLTELHIAIVAAKQQENKRCADYLDEEADRQEKAWIDFLASGSKGPASSSHAIPRGYAKGIRSLLEQKE